MSRDPHTHAPLPKRQAKEGVCKEEPSEGTMAQVVLEDIYTKNEHNQLLFNLPYTHVSSHF